MKKILIVSDTHANDAWLKLIAKQHYDIIIHAGDHLMKDKIKDYTSYYVDGNNDWNNKNIDEFIIEGLKFCLIHGDELHLGFNQMANEYKLQTFLNDHVCDVLIFGHTHIPYVNKYQNTLIINPGSMNFNRHNFKKSYVELIIDNQKIIDFNFFNWE